MEAKSKKETAYEAPNSRMRRRDCALEPEIERDLAESDSQLLAKRAIGGTGCKGKGQPSLSPVNTDWGTDRQHAPSVPQCGTTAVLYNGAE